MLSKYQEVTLRKKIVEVSFTNLSSKLFIPPGVNPYNGQGNDFA